MSLLTRRVAVPSWKIGALKFSMISFGILVGSYLHEFWQNWYLALWVFFGVTAFVSAIWGFQAMFGTNLESKRAT